MIIDLVVPDELHEDTRELVRAFAGALAEKLRQAEVKYGYSDGWLKDDWREEWDQQFRQHLEKGDLRDIAIYAAFGWWRQWLFLPRPSAQEARDPWAICIMIVEEECYLDRAPRGAVSEELFSTGAAIRARIKAAKEDTAPYTTRHAVCEVCGEIADLTCGPSRFGPDTWACKQCWNPDEAHSS